jgi:hypothetical protein
MTRDFLAFLACLVLSAILGWGFVESAADADGSTPGINQACSHTADCWSGYYCIADTFTSDKGHCQRVKVLW